MNPEAMQAFLRHEALRADITSYWEELVLTAQLLNPSLLARGTSMLLDTLASGRVIFVAGNGGSAATASHFACDLAKNVGPGGAAAFRVIALTDNAPMMTALGNDLDFSQIFAGQLRSLAQPGDLLMVISASGTSPNIVAAVQQAQIMRMRTLALTGKSGGTIGSLVDLAIRAPSEQIEVVEDAHLAMTHSFCVAARSCLAGEVDRVIVEIPSQNEVALEAAP